MDLLRNDPAQYFTLLKFRILMSCARFWLHCVANKTQSETPEFRLNNHSFCDSLDVICFSIDSLRRKHFKHKALYWRLNNNTQKINRFPFAHKFYLFSLPQSVRSLKLKSQVFYVYSHHFVSIFGQIRSSCLGLLCLHVTRTLHTIHS